MATIKSNFSHNFILTIANYIFPLVVFPYISRVLGVDGIGVCEFVDNIINYYILFSMMGINVLGIREIANSKNDCHKLSHTFSSLFLLNSLTTIFVLIVLIASIFLVPNFYAHKELMWIGVCKILFNLFVIEWFYKGIEDFKYITKRTIIIKSIFVLCVFLFVKGKNDFGIYYLLTAIMVCSNAIINTVYRRKFVKVSFKNITIHDYIKPFFMLGVYVILTSLYTIFNVVYLGFVIGTQQVGFFSVASKIVTLALGVFTAFTSVMLPRMSMLYSKGSSEEFCSYINKSFRVLLLFSIPVIILLELFAVHIVSIIAGAGYGESVVLLRILSPLVLISGLEQILIWEVLMPQKNDKSIFIFSAIGAIVGIMLNILLVPRMEGVGSSISWLLSEFIIMICAIVLVNKTTDIYVPIKFFLKILGISVPCVLVVYIFSLVSSSHLLGLVFGIMFVVTYYYFIYSHFIKDEMIIGLLESSKTKIKNLKLFDR